eukprot:461134_1
MLPDQNLILQELGTNAVESQSLSHLLQSAYQGRYDPSELQQALDKHKDSLSNPLSHKHRDDTSMQYIVNNRNNYQLDGISQRFQLSDQDLDLIHKFAESTNLDQKYVVAYLRDARVHLETERQQQQLRQLSFQPLSQTTQSMPQIKQFIKNAYFNARKLRLKVLRELIVVYDRINPKHQNAMNEDGEAMYPQELTKIMNDTVQYIFSKNVISNLCQSIQNILNPTDRSFAEDYQIELCDCVAIFYAISQRIKCNTADIKSLLRLFENMIVNKEFVHSHRIRSCSYLVSLSLYQVLDPSDHSPYINPRNNSEIGPNDVLNSGHELSTALNTMTNNLSTINKVHTANRQSASFLLLIIVMIYKIQAKVEQKTYNTKYCSIALRHGALEGLYSDLLLSPALLDEFGELKSILFVTLADVFCELFELCDKDTRDYYAREKKSITQMQYSGHSGHKKQLGLTTMLHVLIYLAHNSQAFCDVFIKNASGKSFIEFLDNTADLPTPWFHLYAGFIYELARVKPNLVYQHITTEKCEKLTIDAIWQILEKTVHIYTAQQVNSSQVVMDQNRDTSNNPYEQLLNQQRINSRMNTSQHEKVWVQPPEMNDQEVRIVCAVLKVLEALGSIEAVQHQINHQHRQSSVIGQPGIIELLFGLLKCSIPTEVMAQTISCVTSFIHKLPNQADRVWNILERDQVLYTQRQKNQPITKGVELDIIEGEKDGTDAIYPVTVAFCKLLKNLLQTTEIPQLLGQGTRGQRPPGIHPYTDYIRDIVFLRWSKREYRHSREQWELAATCLQIFEALLDKFNAAHLTPNSNIRYLFTQHPSFELLTLLLAPHSNLIEVILDIYQKAFKIIDEDAQYKDDTMLFVQSALKNSLNLIQRAIKKEDSFLNICQKYWPQRLSLRPLNTTLLSQQYREQIICLAKCIEYGNDVEMASHSLSILSHLNKTQQGITLRSVFTDQIHTLQTSFSSQLFNPPQQLSSDEEPLPNIRVSIVQFLLKSLKVSGHNLGLMLLAFSEQSASRDQLQSHTSCLNAILKIALEPEFCLHSSALAECCFELLFRLLAHPRIGERFLNAAETACSSFFVTLLRQNIACTSVLPNNPTSNQQQILTCFLNQRAWILKAISFEFHLASSFKKFENIIDPQDKQYLGFLNDPNTDDTEFALWKVFQLLEVNVGADITAETNTAVYGVHMDQFKQYASPQNNGTYTWNITKMYFALDRAPLSQNDIDKQRTLKKMSEDALDHNLRVLLMSALDRAYDAWAELIRCVLSNKIIGYSQMNNQLLLKLLDQILNRLSTRVCGPLWVRVSNTISQVALNIMHFFRHSLGEECPVKIDFVGCQTICEGMVNAILQQKDVRNPRANLYSSLSNYLHYSKFKVPNVLSDVDESKAINLNEKVTTEKDRLNHLNVAILLARKDDLLHVMFSDSVSKDAYLSSVSSLVLQALLSQNDNVSLDLNATITNISPPRIWLSMMLDKSRLLFVLKHACDLDEDIQKALASQRHWYFLYQFESMMDVLIAASVFEEGSMALINNNCISQYLTQLKCLTSRVFWTAYSSQQQNQNDSLSMECLRYLQLLTPCLRLMNSMFASCPKNVRLHYQTLSFFEKHNDIINKLLTLDKNEFVVLRCIKLILSIWYQLYCGPLYIADPNRISTVSARDSNMAEHIESKLHIFYFLMKKFKDIAFPTDQFVDQIMINESMDTQIKGETKESIAREIVRVLINIFRFKSIGARDHSSANHLPFTKIFEKDLNSNTKIDDNPPTLRLLCDCLMGILPISKRSGKWIADQNHALRQCGSNNNASMLAKLQYIEPMLSTVSMDVNLQCFLIENILLLLYFHCEFYLKAFENDFYHKFSSVVMSEVIQALIAWYKDEECCILHVRQDMIEKRWSSGVHIPKSSQMFIEIMLEKFHILDRDNRNVLSLEQ